MSIKTITTDDLRRMKGKEGLILQGCGGDPQEWLDGINDLLTKEGILLNGSKFENCSVFRHGELTCILYPFEGTELNIGKFAVWRLATHDNFGGTWLSDYVPNRLGGFEGEIPDEDCDEDMDEGFGIPFCLAIHPFDKFFFCYNESATDSQGRKILVVHQLVRRG